MLTLWNIFGAPLMIGGELTLLNDKELRMLTNKELLALNDGQHFGQQVQRDSETAVWTSTDCHDGTITAAIFNLSDEDGERTVSFEQLGLAAQDGSAPDEIRLHELWDKTNHTARGGVITAGIPAHGVKVYRLL